MSDPLIQVNNLSIGYTNRAGVTLPILRNIDLAFGKGDGGAGPPAARTIGFRLDVLALPQGANGVDPFPLRFDLVAAHEQRLVALDQVEQ